MKINLEPYNYYILYAAIILLLICICYTCMKALSLLKEIKKEQVHFDSIQTNITLSKIKAEAIQEKKAETHKNDKYFKVLLPILLAIYTTYRNDEELKGIKGYQKAASKVMDQKMHKQFVQNFIKTI